MSEKQFENHYAVAMGLGAGIGGVLNIGTGLCISLLYLTVVIRLSGWPEEKRRNFWKQRGRAVLLGLTTVFLILACFKGLISNWADVKEGFLEGYRTFSR